MGVRGGGPLRGRVQGVHAGREFRAAGGRSAVVVLGPGEVGGQDVRVLLPGRGGEAVCQIGPAVRRVHLAGLGPAARGADPAGLGRVVQPARDPGQGV
ncbi:hypothetical protein, partial [Streptomyces pseudogriseolus]|uniref:hypothetical protein n=1 Tax=Streptomyces pseudogriseolus TaxID=36817 RepID=UPI003FA29CD9